MHVWDSKSDASISFHNQDGSNLALIIENDLVQESLVRILSKIPNLEVFYQSKINDYEHKDQFVELKLNNGQLLRTKLLIGNDFMK
jgi:2-polyprenyl-6-methoxyphenol hydroxylase-like FAD-dependent oxidoreductase